VAANEGDRNVAGVQANSVPGVFSVTNHPALGALAMTTYQETTQQEPTHQETTLQETHQEPEWHPTVAFHRAQVLCVSAAVVAIIVIAALARLVSMAGHDPRNVSAGARSCIKWSSQFQSKRQK